MRRLIGVYGAAGYGREIMPLIREQYAAADVVFIDDGKKGDHVNGDPVLDWAGFCARSAPERYVSIAISASKTRQALAERCDGSGILLVQARAASVVAMDAVEIGDGACLSPFVTLTSNIRIGRCFHANLYSYVAHDCVIGDFVTFGPAAKVNGNVSIGDHAYIGAGAVLRQGVRIGARATVGMGAVVIRDVPPGATVVGNPAKPLVKD